MKKFIKNYQEYINTLSKDEIDYLLKQDPNKLIGGKNLIGLKNTITFYRTCCKEGSLLRIFKKYSSMIKDACLADNIYLFVDKKGVNKI